MGTRRSLDNPETAQPGIRRSLSRERQNGRQAGGSRAGSRQTPRRAEHTPGLGKPPRTHSRDGVRRRKQRRRNEPPEEEGDEIPEKRTHTRGPQGIATS